jgi:hypothetical protein
VCACVASRDGNCVNGCSRACVRGSTRRPSCRASRSAPPFPAFPRLSPPRRHVGVGGAAHQSENDVFTRGTPSFTTIENPLRVGGVGVARITLITLITLITIRSWRARMTPRRETHMSPRSTDPPITPSPSPSFTFRRAVCRPADEDVRYGLNNSPLNALPQVQAESDMLAKDLGFQVQSRVNTLL